jgi:hypothetical protein
MPLKEIPGERTTGQRVSMALTMYDGPSIHPFERAAVSLRSAHKGHGYDRLPGNLIQARRK